MLARHRTATDEFAPGTVKLWTGHGGQVGITSLTQDRVYWFATQNMVAGQHAADEHGLVNEAFNYGEPLPEVLASTATDKVFRADIIDRPPSRPWSKGHCVLIGDAAHAMTPNFGQGGSMAIEDGVVLARNLAHHANDPPAAFAAFETERYPHTTAITNEAWRFGKVLQLEGPRGVAARLHVGNHNSADRNEQSRQTCPL